MVLGFAVISPQQEPQPNKRKTGTMNYRCRSESLPLPDSLSVCSRGDAGSSDAGGLEALTLAERDRTRVASARSRVGLAAPQVAERVCLFFEPGTEVRVRDFDEHLRTVADGTPMQVSSAIFSDDPVHVAARRDDS